MLAMMAQPQEPTAMLNHRGERIMPLPYRPKAHKPQPQQQQRKAKKTRKLSVMEGGEELYRHLIKKQRSYYNLEPELEPAALAMKRQESTERVTPFDLHLQAVYEGQAEDGLQFFESHGYYDVTDANTVEMFRQNFGLGEGFWLVKKGEEEGYDSEEELLLDCVGPAVYPFGSQQQIMSSRSLLHRERTNSGRFTLLDDDGNEVDEHTLWEMEREDRLKAKSLELDDDDLAELAHDELVMVEAITVIRTEKSKLQQFFLQAFQEEQARAVHVPGPVLRQAQRTELPPAMPPADLELPPYCGYVNLLKDTIPFLMRSWHKRWFYLDFQAGVVLMYKRSYWKSPRGVVDLRNVAHIEKMSHGDFRIEFRDTGADAPSMMLMRSKTPEEAELWVNLLRFAKQASRGAPRAKVKAEAEETPAEVEAEEQVKPTKVKHEVKVEAAPAPAAATSAATGHVQSERNARRRQHREFLREVERRKEEQASVEQKSVLIFGLGADVTQKHVQKKAKKVGAVDKVELKEEARTGKTYALVQFKSTKDAALAVAKLDHHIFKGSVLQVKSAAKAVVVDEKGTAGKPGHVKHTAEAEGLRLIVRNLAFQTTDKDLEKLFEVHGPLFEVRVVRMPVEDDKKKSEEGDEETEAEPVLGRSRGFGFVQYRDVADARTAVEKLNGTKLKGREMIVDFALSKTKYLEQQKKHEEDAVAAATPGEGDGDDEEANSGDEDEDQLEMATDDEAGTGSDDSDNEGEEEEHEEEVAPAPKEDTEAQRDRTLFIRNLSFQTSEDGLREFFQTFGAVEYARVVYEKGSNLSKGVGFVRFKSADVAAEVLKRGEQPQADDKKKHKKDKKKENLFTLSALADGGDDALTLDGRQLILSRAVSKTDAEHLADSNARERRRLDKRNLYLAYEGTLNVNKMADTELELPKMDIDKRRRAIREKKLKLQNPMYFVSPMRLSVRNLSTALDDRKLKKLFHDAASAGVRAGNVDRTEIKPELLSKGNPPVKVRMAKVVRDMESAKAGKDPRSRGYGFVEFSEHLHALAALRVLNNNPKYTSYAAGRVSTSGAPDSSKSRLIVEFALENHGKLKLREKRAADAAKKREEERALKEAQGEDGEDAEKAKKSRGQRQREKKKLRALAKAEAKAEGENPKFKKATKVTKEVKQQPKKRKRAEAPRGDAEADALASLEAAPTAKRGKTLSRNQRKHVKELEKEKSFEAMVRSYKKEIFGEQSAAGGTTSKGDEGAKGADRWFD